MASSPRRHRLRRCEQPSPPATGWAALPRDILVTIFLHLGFLEVMPGAGLTCTSWRRAALGEPLLWRRLDLRTVWRSSRGWRSIVRAAARNGGDWSVAFSGPCDNHSLLDLVDRAPCLKSLDLFDYVASNEVLTEAITRLHLLEDLEISPAYNCPQDYRNLFPLICQAYPRLKRLVMGFQALNDDRKNRDGGELAIPVMCELRYLELFSCELCPMVLAMILDSCPLLESLHITGSFRSRHTYRKFRKELQVKCARLRNVTLPDHGRS